MSAHHYFRRFAYCDSGMIPVAAGGADHLRIAASRCRSWSASASRASRSAASSTTGCRTPRPRSRRVEARYAPQALAIDRTDGVSFEFRDWRFNLRSSEHRAADPPERRGARLGGADAREDRRTARAAASRRAPWPRTLIARSRMAASMPKLSVVIPVYNEEQVLPTPVRAPVSGARRARHPLRVRVRQRRQQGPLGRAAARSSSSARPRETRVVLFHANFGQHSAVMAGLVVCARRLRGDAGCRSAESAGGDRQAGRRSSTRATTTSARSASSARTCCGGGCSRRAINKLRERITPVRITDQGCMMRGYARSVVTALNQTREINTFIPALASLYAMNPIEVPIAHEERHAGQSKYSMYSLIRLNFDLITGFSVVPLQLFSMVGMAVSTLSALLVVYLFVRRIMVGPEAEGLFTLFGRRVLLHRPGAVRHRPAGRVRRPHLRPGARAAALHRRGRARRERRARSRGAA